MRLTHDLSQEIRYVGLSSRGDKRLKDHLRTYDRPTYKSYHKALYRWMRKHRGQVTFEILEDCSKNDLLLVEMKWIHIMKARGHRLLNATDGGEGFATYVPTPEHRAKMAENILAYTSTNSNCNLGKKIPRDECGMYGKTHNKNTRDLIGSYHKGKTISEEHKKRISEASKGKVGRDKLDKMKVLQIREARASGTPISDLADSYGVSRPTISKVVLRKTWKQV